MRFAALFMATTLSCLVVMSLVTVHATFDGQSQRAHARNPVLAPKGTPPKALWSRYWDTSRGRQFTVVVVEPLSSQAPLPPGLARWPAPGEVFVSAALARDPQTEGFAQRYGEIGGRVSEAGLSTPGERLAYVRPARAMVQSSYLDPIVGFGSPGPDFGDAALVEPGRQVQLGWLIALLVGLPALAATAAAARMAVARRSGLVAPTAGAAISRSARIRTRLAVSLTPVGAGALIATGVALAGMTWNIRLPWIGFVIAAADVRRAAPAVLLGMAVAAMLVLAVALFIPQRGDDHGSSARSSTSHMRQGPTARRVALGAGTAGVAVTYCVGGSPSQDLHAFYLCGVIVVWASLPTLIAWATERLTHRWTVRAHRRGQLLALRWHAANPAGTIRLIAALAIAFGVIGQSQLLSSMLFHRAGDIQAVTRLQGQRAALVQAADRSSPASAFVDALPAGHGVISMGHDSTPTTGNTGWVIQAPCRDLAALALPCPGSGTEAQLASARLDRRITATSAMNFTSAQVKVRVGEAAMLDPQDVWLLVFDRDGGHVNMSTVKAAAHRRLSTDAKIMPMRLDGQSFALGYQTRWLTFLSTAGTGILGLALLLTLLSTFLACATGPAASTAPDGHGRTERTAAIWAMGMPIAASGLVAIAAYLFLGLPATDGELGLALSAPLCLAFLATLVTAGFGVTMTGGTVAARRARQHGRSTG
ncbi:hypothetical protein ACGFX2_33485 [Streptomyces goshikiensis]|uniref:hypothetical protein n=1 Tax=Streptomyces goshikiensis TaxID=1942 RepID=UPI00371A278F